MPADGGVDRTSLLELVSSAGNDAKLHLSLENTRRLCDFVELLLLWRRSTALVSQRTPSEIVAKHLQDSFSIIPFAAEANRIADLGSGAGFPGIPIAVLCPRTKVLLVESKRRKSNFLRQAVRITSADNAEVAEVRAEKLATESDQANSFDLVVSRASWSAGDFFALAKPLLLPNAIAIAMRAGEEPDTCASPPGYGPLRFQRYELSRGEKRTLLIARTPP